ncbi:hypothetical protein INR49_004713 [Caranx melampygus]|nr:hypothetical protein INR49_004713 [Caranx melampygus]
MNCCLFIITSVTETIRVLAPASLIQGKERRADCAAKNTNMSEREIPTAVCEPSLRPTDLTLERPLYSYNSSCSSTEMSPLMII